MALVEVAKIQNCTVLKLNQPEQRNTLTTQMSGELIQHINQAEADENIKSVIVTGNGPAFCAGADLGDLLSDGRGEGDQLQQIYAGFLAVANCSLPTIAAIFVAKGSSATTNGYCAFWASILPRSSDSVRVLSSHSAPIVRASVPSDGKSNSSL